MKQWIDKSRGKGCITCEVEKGKTCEGCIHRDDILKRTMLLKAHEGDSCYEAIAKGN